MNTTKAGDPGDSPNTPNADGPTTSPARTPIAWSGRKTAVGAALAIGLATGAGVAAAHEVPAGSISAQSDHGMGHGAGPGSAHVQQGMRAH